MTRQIWINAVVLWVGISVIASAQYVSEFNTQGPSARAIGEGELKGGTGETGPYEVDAEWPQPLPNHEGWTWGRTAGVWAESPDRVFVFQSGELPALPADQRIGRHGVPGRAAAYAAKDNRKEHLLMIFDRDGRLVDSWEQHNDLFQSPHSVKINPHDPERHVWIIDNGAHVVRKFTNDGKLVMTLGEPGVSGLDAAHFGGPTDIAFLPNGNFYISDGYGNSRVVNYSKDGKYLMDWGTWGAGPSQFNQPHSITIDEQGRVYVADRANSRIQVFDSRGQYLDEWPNIRFPLHIRASADGHLWVADMLTHQMLKYNLEGRLIYSWGVFGGQPGHLWGVHGFSTDAEGNFYVAEVFNGRVQKFKPKKGLEAWKFVGSLTVS